MSKRNAGIYLSLLIIIGSVGSFLYINANIQVMYPLSQCYAFLNNAQGEAYADEMAANVEVALDLLIPYSGNPVWFFPTQATNMDDIKEDLTQIADRLWETHYELNTTSDAYQQALDDIRDDIAIQAERISVTKDWYLLTPLNILGLILVWVLSIILISLVIKEAFD